MKKYPFPNFLLYLCFSLCLWRSNEAVDYIVYVTLTNATEDTALAIENAFKAEPPSQAGCFEGKTILFSLPPFVSDYPSLNSLSSLYTVTRSNESEIVFIIGDDYRFDNRFFNNKITTSLKPISPVRSVYGFTYTQDVMEPVLGTLYKNFFTSLPNEVASMVFVIESDESLDPLGGGSIYNPVIDFNGRLVIYHYGHSETTYATICQKILKSGVKNIVVQLSSEYAYGLIAEAVLRRLFHWSYRWIILNANIARTLNDQRLETIYSQNFTMVDITALPTKLTTKDSIIYRDMATITRCILEYGFGCTTDFTCPSPTLLTGNFNFSTNVPQLAQRISYNYVVYAGPRKDSDTIYASITANAEGVVISSEVRPLPLINTSREEVLDRLQRQNPLRILVIESPPFVILTPGNATTNNKTYPIQDSDMSCSGFAVDVIVKALANLGITNYVFNNEDEIVYGTDNDTSYTGAIGKINQQLYDIGLGTFVPTTNILDAVDFLIPVTKTPTSILYKVADKSFFANFFSFISPFEWTVWAVIGGTNVAYAILLWIMHLISPNENDFNLYNSIFFITSTLVQGTVLASPDRVSGRILTCFWWFFNLTLTITYVCSYGSQFTDTRLTVAISGLKDLLLNEDYDYGTISESALEYYLDNSPLTVEQQISQNMRSVDLPTNIVDAVKNVQEGGYALIWFKYTNDYYSTRYCLRGEGAFDQYPIQFPMSKGHEYFSIINDALIQLSKDSTLTQLENKWFMEIDGVCTTGKNWLENIVKVLDTDFFYGSSPNSLGFSSMGGIFIITLLGCTVTMIVALIELIVRVVSQRKKRREQERAERSGRRIIRDPKSRMNESSA